MLSFDFTVHDVVFLLFLEDNDLCLGKHHAGLRHIMHDGLGVWLAARRLNQGRFVWPRAGQIHVELTGEQLQALVIGLPWHRIGDDGIIDVI